MSSKKRLIDQARENLLKTQDADIKETTRHRADVSEIQRLFNGFISDCSGVDLAPTVDIGQLRRDRWRQWKRIPAEYRQNAPLKTFRETPGYIFEVNVAKYKEEFCLATDGTIYKHQLNAPDPYPVEDILRVATVEKVAEGLVRALITMLRARQHPAKEITEMGPSEEGARAVEEDNADKLDESLTRHEDVASATLAAQTAGDMSEPVKEEEPHLTPEPLEYPNPPAPVSKAENN